MTPDRTVHFRSDGLSLSPAQYAELLARLAREEAIEADEFSRGGAVALLETRMAAALGKEAAVFLPSGTLANHLALRRLARHGRRVLVQADSHIYCDSGDCATVLSGLNLVPLAELTPGSIAQAAEAAVQGRVAAPVGAISIESPVRRAAGAVVEFATMQQICGFARERQIGLHLDGARLFLAAPYTGVPPYAYAALFDTVYVSLYKYFNAAGGAILAGPRALLDDLYEERRTFGGSLRQAWPCAAVALHCLDGFEARFASAVRASEALLDALRRHPGCRIEHPGTNVAFLKLRREHGAGLPERLRRAGILIRPPRDPAEERWTEFELTVNETILRRPVDELAAAFLDALGRD